MTRLLDEGEDAQPYITEADRSPWDRRAGHDGEAEDYFYDPDYREGIGAFGFIVAAAIILAVAIVGLWLDYDPAALALFGGSR